MNNRIEAHLNNNGRKLIGWDEILEGGVSQNATIMSWRGTEGGIAAAKKGNYVGGLVAYYYGIGNMNNITANRVEVNGVNYVGAITGYIYMADTDGVNITKSNVTATGNYVGLLSGQIADNANAQSYKVSNITITGTPTYTEGVITGSDITVKGVAQVGAIAGRSYQGDCYKNGVEANSANNVNGVHIIGGGNYVGGAYGYHYNNS